MKNLLIIGLIWPEPNSTAAGKRMLQLINLFQNLDYRITFVCAASKNTNTFDLSSINVSTIPIELNNSSFDQIIKNINPTIVLFDRYLTEEQYGWRVIEIIPNALRILDTEDLHFLRNARHEAFKNETEVSLNYLFNDIAKREIASIYRCDLSLIISTYEMQLLTKTFNINANLLAYIPFLFEKLDKNSLKKYPDFLNRNHFISMGNFKHEPNWNAVLTLKTTIWPLIKKVLPQSEVHIYGAYTSEKVKQLHNQKQGFIIKGWAENTETTYSQYKVCLAPLQFGAGLKGKLTDAMIYGTPSITTSIGAEAMHDNLPWNGFICNSPEVFATKAIELYTTKNVWETAQKNGLEIINNLYQRNKFEENLAIQITTILKDIEKHRLYNFLGAMLMHHSLKSTKYFSKWIEEKAKKS
jgi:glycosyltransferase involved in cell wall biosynthesis